MGETKAKLIKNEQPIAQGPRARGRRDAPVRTRVASPARARGAARRRAWRKEAFAPPRSIRRTTTAVTTVLPGRPRRERAGAKIETR